MAELLIEEPKTIEDGKHEGVITGVEYREQPYKYTDLVIEFEEGKKIKAGFPTMVTEESKLGKLMLLFGASLKVGQTISPERLFVGRKCSFMTLTKETDKGSFPIVVAGSVKPMVK